MGHKVNFDFDAFLRGYLACASWCGVDPEDPNAKGETDFDPALFTTRAVAHAAKDCRGFVRDNLEALEGLDAEQCGYDFWLTRNHHGAGFWDRGYPDGIGYALTKASHSCGEEYVFVSRYGKLNFS